MNSKNNKDLIKNEINNQKQLGYSDNKYRLIVIIFIFGLALLILLYIKFEAGYKLNDYNKDNTNNAKIINNNLAKENLLNHKNKTTEAILNNSSSSNKEPNSNLSIEREQSAKESSPIEPDHNAEVLNQESLTSLEKPVNSRVDDSKCMNFIRFLQYYYQMKLNILLGEDFTEPLLELTQYVIYSDKLKINLVNLLHLAHENIAPIYFELEFQKLVKEIYKNNQSFLPFNLREYFLIRRVGERAMDFGGLDKTVYLIEQALENNDLEMVSELLNSLPQNTQSLDEFKTDIKNRILIEQSLNNIDEILLHNSNCEMVGK